MPAWQNNKTPEGREKCYKYQKKQCPGNCGRVHACLACGGTHPVWECPKRPRGKGGDAAGRAP